MEMDEKVNVLVVEDESYISRLFDMVLTAAGYKVMIAKNGSSATALLTSNMVDLLLLDLGLPDMDGLEVLRELRAWSNIPVIVVSAREMERDKVLALDLGADDYITKPFSAPELLARMRAALRRTVPGVYDETYTVGNLCVDFNKRRVTVAGVPIRLTQVEYRIVEMIAKQPGCVLTYAQIIRGVWGPYAPTDDNKILRVNMANIRRKIEDDNVSPRYILTEIGVGYRMAGP